MVLQPVLNQNLLHVDFLCVYVARRLVRLNGQYMPRGILVFRSPLAVLCAASDRV